LQLFFLLVSKVEKRFQKNFRNGLIQVSLNNQISTNWLIGCFLADKRFEISNLQSDNIEINIMSDIMNDSLYLWDYFSCI